MDWAVSSSTMMVLVMWMTGMGMESGTVMNSMGWTAQQEKDELLIKPGNPNCMSRFSREAHRGEAIDDIYVSS